MVGYTQHMRFPFLLSWRYCARVILLVVLLLGVFRIPVVAQDATSSDDQYNKKLQEIEQLKAKLTEVQGQVQTLSSALSYINNKKALIQKQIEATQFQIEVLERDIDSLSGKITTLEKSLNNLTTAFLHNVTMTYEHRDIDDVSVLLSSKGFSDMINRYAYLSVTQKYRQDILTKTTQAKMDYDNEKNLKEKKQKTIESLKSQYVKQQQDLVVQEQAKKLLLSQTKDSEANYQRLLTQANAELNALRGFSASKTGGMLPPQNSPDGWYFSQRDQRWGGMCIANSCGTRNQGTIYEVGCLIADIAMVKKKYGEDVTPITIASNPSYFFSTTAYMLQPWAAPGGYRYERSGYDQGKLDNELKEGRPVIAHLQVNTRDGHFIVIKSGSGGQYVMHDPWEGYDKKFSDFYRISQITSMNILKKN
jgi:peptidoglycan hydrolase CwlO-like protein